MAARKYSKKAGAKVKRAMHKRKEGSLKSGKGGKGGKVTSKKQAIAIGLNEARKEGKKVPKKKTGGAKKKSSGGAKKKTGGAKKKTGGAKKKRSGGAKKKRSAKKSSS